MMYVYPSNALCAANKGIPGQFSQAGYIAPNKCVTMNGYDVKVNSCHGKKLHTTRFPSTDNSCTGSYIHNYIYI